VSDQALELALLAMQQPVGDILGVIPLLNSKVGTPAKFMNILPGNFFPLASRFQLKSHLTRLVGHQGKELGCHFQHAPVMGIDSKCQDLITRDQQARFLVPLGHPPLASGIAIELWKVRTKRLVFDGMQPCGCQQNKEGQEQDPFHGSYLVKWCIESIQSMKCQLQVTHRDW
jgi:hypothetical protein